MLTRPRDLFMATPHGSTRTHLLSNEQILLSYAADDVQDIVTLSEREELVLQLARQVQEQQLEKALLEQGEEALYAGSAFSSRDLLFVDLLQ